MSQRNACIWPRLAGPPSARYACAWAATPDRHRRALHQLRARLSLATEDDQRQSAATKDRELRHDLGRGPEHPQHDEGSVARSAARAPGAPGCRGCTAPRWRAPTAGRCRRWTATPPAVTGIQRTSRAPTRGSRPTSFGCPVASIWLWSLDTHRPATFTVAEPPRVHTGFLRHETCLVSVVQRVASAAVAPLISAVAFCMSQMARATAQAVLPSNVLSETPRSSLIRLSR